MFRFSLLLALVLVCPSSWSYELTGLTVKRGGDGATRFDRISPVVVVGPGETVEVKVFANILSGPKEEVIPLRLPPTEAVLSPTDPEKFTPMTKDFDLAHSGFGLTQIGLYKIVYVVQVTSPSAPGTVKMKDSPVIYLPVGVAEPEKVAGTQGIYPQEIRELALEKNVAFAWVDGELVEKEYEVATIDPNDRGIVRLPPVDEPVGGGVPVPGNDDTTEKLILFAKILEAQSIKAEEARAAEAATYAKRAADEGKSLIYYFSNRPDIGVRKNQPWFDSFRYDARVNYAPCVKNAERFGRTNVYVPPSSRARGTKGLKGNILNPWDNDSFAVLNEHSPLTGYDMILELWKTPVLVYTHGFNTTFEEALIQAAQLKEDLGWPHAMLVLDWPSFGEASLESYRGDRKMAELSADQVAKFMEALNLGSQVSTPELFDRAQRGTRHYLNHSMGNYVYMKAIGALEMFGGNTSRLKEGFFNQVIFAAPDVDAKEFTNGLTLLTSRKAVDWTTLYYSRKDVAVTLSRVANPETTRVGVTPVFFPGLTTINADLVNSSLSSLLGFRHDYYGSADPLLFDLSLLLKYGMGADQRRPPLTEGRRVGNSTYMLYHIH